MKTIKINCGSAKDPDPLDPQDFGFLGSGSESSKICGSTDSNHKGQNINQKLQKKLFYSQNPNLNC